MWCSWCHCVQNGIIVLYHLLELGGSVDDDFIRTQTWLLAPKTNTHLWDILETYLETAGDQGIFVTQVTMCLVNFVLPQVTFDQIRFWSTGSCGHIHPKPWICHIGETMWNMGCWLGLLMNSNRRHHLVIWIPLSLGTTCVSLNFVQHTQNKTHQSAIIVLSQQTYWQDALDLNCKSYIIHNARSAETAETVIQGAHSCSTVW